MTATSSSSSSRHKTKTGGSLPELTRDLIVYNAPTSSNHASSCASTNKQHTGLADKFHLLTERLHNLSHGSNRNNATDSTNSHLEIGQSIRARAGEF